MTALFGITLFDFGDFAEVDFNGTVADEFDVVETHHALAVEIDGGVAGGDVGDWFADGFPDSTAPAGVEGTHNFSAQLAGGRRRARKDWEI